MCSSQKRKQPFRGVALRYALIKCNSVWGGGGAATRNSIRAKFCKFRGCMGCAWASRRAGNKKALARLRPRTFPPQLANAPSSRAERTHHIAPRQQVHFPFVVKLHSPRVQRVLAVLLTKSCIGHWRLASREETESCVVAARNPHAAPTSSDAPRGRAARWGQGEPSVHKNLHHVIFATRHRLPDAKFK